MDFRQITMMQKIKSGMDRFRANHPKFPMFLRAVSQMRWWKERSLRSM